MPDICFWNKCDNKCVMCTNPPEFSKASPIGNYDLKTQIAKFKAYMSGAGDIYRAGNGRLDYISITGGEPTMHPRFLSLLYYIRKSAPRAHITLLTNGRRLGDASFFKKFIKIAAQPFSVAIPLHAADASNFEKITGIKGSFDQSLAGLDNLLSFFPGPVDIRVVIHRMNINLLGEIIDFIQARWGKRKNLRVVFIHYEIEGMSSVNSRKVGLRLPVSAAKLLSCLKALKGLNFELYHYPLCVLNPKLRRYARITLPDDERVYTAKCSKCSLRKKCLGLMKEYYSSYGDGELKPIRKK